MKHNILLWMTVCLLGTSCSNILDKEPDFVSPDYYYNTESELLQALNGVYNRLIDTNGRMYSNCLLYTSPSPRDYAASRMPSSA